MLAYRQIGSDDHTIFCAECAHLTQKVRTAFPDPTQTDNPYGGMGDKLLSNLKWGVVITR